MAKNSIRIDSKALEKQLTEAIKRNPKVTAQKVKSIVLDLAGRSSSIAPVESGDLRNNCVAKINNTVLYENQIYDGFHTGSTKGEKVLNSLDGITRVIFGDGWSDFWQGVGEKIQSGFQTAWNKITSIFGGAGAWFGGIWSNIQSAFGSVATWFRDTFSEAWQNVKNVFSTGGEVFSGITTGILDSFKEVVNMLIDGINEVITIPFNGINTALESIRDVRIMGATPFGWLSTIEVPQIPHLATGTVVPANYGEFLAVLGDNKRETEVVSPLSTIKRAVAEAMSQTNGTQGDIVINVSMFPNERTFQRYVVKAYHNEIARGGKL